MLIYIICSGKHFKPRPYTINKSTDRIMSKTPENIGVTKLEYKSETSVNELKSKTPNSILIYKRKSTFSQMCK